MVVGSILISNIRGTYIPELEGDTALGELIDIQSFEYTLHQAMSPQTCKVY